MKLICLFAELQWPLGWYRGSSKNKCLGEEAGEDEEGWKKLLLVSLQ